MVILPSSKEALDKCRLELEGHYSLSGVDILVSDWPRGDGCHKPDSAVMDEDGKVVAHSNELHEAFERSQEFDEYTYDCVFGVSATSTAYNFFMTAQHECFCPATTRGSGALSLQKCSVLCDSSVMTLTKARGPSQSRDMLAHPHIGLLLALLVTLP